MKNRIKNQNQKNKKRKDNEIEQEMKNNSKGKRIKASQGSRRAAPFFPVGGQKKQPLILNE